MCRKWRSAIQMYRHLSIMIRRNQGRSMCPNRKRWIISMIFYNWIKTPASLDLKVVKSFSILRLVASNSKAVITNHLRKMPVKLSIWNIALWEEPKEIITKVVPKNQLAVIVICLIHPRVVVNSRNRMIIARWTRALRCHTINLNIMTAKSQVWIWWVIVQLELRIKCRRYHDSAKFWNKFRCLGLK